MVSTVGRYRCSVSRGVWNLRGINLGGDAENPEMLGGIDPPRFWEHFLAADFIEYKAFWVGLLIGPPQARKF